MDLHILPHSVSGVIALAFAIFISYQTSVYIYNLFFHPLSRFPGPKLAAASSLPKIRNALKGNGVHWVVSLHERYGEVVRIAPNELSFSSAGSLKDIYGHRSASRTTLAKDPDFYMGPGSGTQDLVNSSDENRSRQRRLFANAFSDRALKKQEPLFLTYVNKLCEKIRTQIKKNPQHQFNIVSLYNFTTFDVMGHLTFGEPLGMLDGDSYHPWVAAIFANFRFGTYLHAMRCYPVMAKLSFRALLAIFGKKMEEKRKMHHEFSHARVDKRLAKQDPRPDIWGLVLEKSEDSDRGLTREEMYVNSNLFMIAGTETTATLLSGLTYYLFTNRDKLKILTDEIRGAFTAEDEITIERLQALSYLNACVEEGLRMYPPISNGLPRMVPHEGVKIDGTEVPGGRDIKVMATHLATYRNSKNFRDPYAFVPERWLASDVDYSSDKKHALQPFSIGPRACLGKNMAYHEIRIILSKMLWNFDLELCQESESWTEQQKVFIMWDKGPLYCRVSLAKP